VLPKTGPIASDNANRIDDHEGAGQPWPALDKRPRFLATPVWGESRDRRIEEPRFPEVLSSRVVPVGVDGAVPRVDVRRKLVFKSRFLATLAKRPEVGGQSRVSLQWCKRRDPFNIE